MDKLTELKTEKNHLEKQIKRCLKSLSNHVPLSLGYRENRVLLRYYEKRLTHIKSEFELERNKQIENAHLNVE